MIEHFKEILGEERYNQILQEVECKTYEELLDEIDTLQQENQELKKQLKNYKKLGFKYLQDKNNNLEAQQKEFIEYLEKTIVDSKAGSGQQYYAKEHLSKYKEIIGVSNE